MEIPINCPICNHPLINTFNSTTDLVVYKNCRLRPDHIFSCAVFMEDFMANEKNKVDRISFTLSMSPLLSVVIYPQGKLIHIGKRAPNETAQIVCAEELPFYVEPDFSDYPKLIAKLKTYILFS